jgi:hypothetical protein
MKKKLEKQIILFLFLCVSLTFSCKKVGQPNHAKLISNIENNEEYSFNQTLFVRPPGSTYGTGDGSSWTNAFSDLPENLVRGTKYYLASGNYDVAS